MENKKISVGFLDVVTVLQTSNGEVEIKFKPFKRRDRTKLLIDIEKAKQEANKEESIKLIRESDLIPFVHIQSFSGELVDGGEVVTLEQLKSGDISQRLFDLISELFWKSQNPKEDEEAKKASES